MRPWISGGVGAVVAAVVDPLVVRPLELGSPETVALMGLAIFAGVVVLLNTGVFVAGLSRVGRRLREPPRTFDEWENAFARTGFRDCPAACSTPWHSMSGVPIDAFGTGPFRAKLGTA